MSKSLGNLVLVSKMRQRGVDPAVIRLAIMSQHYRSDWFWTEELLEQAERRAALYRWAVDAAEGGPDRAAEELLELVRSHLARDLDAPAALAALDAWAESVKQAGGAGGQLVRDLLSARLGIRL